MCYRPRRLTYCFLKPYYSVLKGNSILTSNIFQDNNSMQNFLDRNAWIEIDLTAISRNILEIKKYLRSDTDIMAVVKANAYGHGITEVAKKSIESNVKILGVAMLDEAELLRKNGIRSEILVMGNALQRESPRIVNLDISQVVSNIEIVRSLSKEARIQKKNAKIHIKIDTGMGRVGIGYIEAVKFIKKIIKLQNIEIQGLMTHFSTADEPDGLDYAYRQLNRFTSVINALKEIGLEIKWRHAANSAGIALIHESHLNLVRPGLLIYGITPTPSPRTLWPSQHCHVVYKRCLNCRTELPLPLVAQAFR